MLAVRIYRPSGNARIPVRPPRINYVYKKLFPTVGSAFAGRPIRVSSYVRAAGSDGGGVYNKTRLMIITRENTAAETRTATVMAPYNKGVFCCYCFLFFFIYYNRYSPHNDYNLFVHDHTTGKIIYI